MDEMRGKVCVVTGASGAIGSETAKGLARRGATVVMAARRPDAGEEARARVVRETGSRDVHLLLADLSSQTQVRHLAAQIEARFGRVDVLVNNAGYYSRTRRLTEDGIDAEWAVNHLAPYLLVHLLLEPLRAAAPSRVVAVSSGAHRGGRLDWNDMQMSRGLYRGYKMYERTKLAVLLFTRELARRLEGLGVTATAMHPGMVDADIVMNGLPPLRLFRRFLRTPEEGARTVVWLASSPEAEGLSGRYFIDERVTEPSPRALDDEDAARLWRWSAELTGVTPDWP
ncbi:MAG TPA: SDR family oxidoreductase [Longimicrobium sp.]|nr:SDR family oxidoreductase [Longimicrobium sp.]